MPYRQFTRDERIMLKAYLPLPLSLREIARQLQRDVGAVSRELTKGGGNEKYSVAVAKKTCQPNRHQKS